MIIECSKNVCLYIKDCFKHFSPSYCYEIEESLIEDKALFDLGFSKNIQCTFEINPKEDIVNIVKKIDALYISDFQNYDYYLEFNNFLKTILRQTDKKVKIKLPY